MVRLTDCIHTVVKWLAAVALLVMMGLTFVDVNLRYWLGQPILGSNEMTEFLLGAVVFAGLVIVCGERSHIVVTLFETPLKRAVPGFYKWLGIVSNLVGILAVAYLVINYTAFMASQGNETEIHRWELWWLGAVMSVLAVLAVPMVLRSIRAPLGPTGQAEAGDDVGRRGDAA